MKKTRSRYVQAGDNATMTYRNTFILLLFIFIIFLIFLFYFCYLILKLKGIS